MFVGILLRDLARDFRLEFESSCHRAIFDPVMPCAEVRARAQASHGNIRELTNRLLSHDGAVGSPFSPASSSCRNLNLRFTVKTTTFMRDRHFFFTQDRLSKCASMAEKKAQL